MTASFVPFTTKAGETIETFGSFTANDIPADWKKVAVLERDCGMKTGERFGFFKLADGRVAEVSFHPMNGANDMFARIGSREFIADRFQELLDGEPFERRQQTYHGLDVTRGRMKKAKRVA